MGSGLRGQLPVGRLHQGLGGGEAPGWAADGARVLGAGGAGGALGAFGAAAESLGQGRTWTPPMLATPFFWAHVCKN